MKLQYTIAVIAIIAGLLLITPSIVRTSHATTNGYVKVTFHFFINCLPAPDVNAKIFDQEQIPPIAKGISSEYGILRLYILPDLDKPLPLMFFAESENQTYKLLGNFFDPSLPYNVTIWVYWGSPCSRN